MAKRNETFAFGANCVLPQSQLSLRSADGYRRNGSRIA